MAFCLLGRLLVLRDVDGRLAGAHPTGEEKPTRHLKILIFMTDQYYLYDLNIRDST